MHGAAFDGRHEDSGSTKESRDDDGEQDTEGGEDDDNSDEDKLDAKIREALAQFERDKAAWKQEVARSSGQDEARSLDSAAESPPRETASS